MQKFTFRKTDDFDIGQILTCGQIFRFEQKENGMFAVWSKNHYAEIAQNCNEVTVNCTDTQYFMHFFDMQRDYSAIKRTLIETGNSEILNDAIEFGKGIRILNQDLFEMIVSFIISANNNIKRIQLIINRICAAVGEKTEYGYAFPTYERLALCDEAFFSQMGAGYRARYLAQSVQLLDNSFLEELKALSTADARKKLLTLKGIGPKVADCILLFGMGRTDSFPVDVWIKRVYRSAFDDGASEKEMSASLVRRFGELSGYAQQYLFFYYRENALKV